MCKHTVYIYYLPLKPCCYVVMSKINVFNWVFTLTLFNLPPSASITMNYRKLLWVSLINIGNSKHLNPCEHIKKSSAKAPEPQLWLYFECCSQKA